MYQKNYTVTLTGVTDLIMHRDSVNHSERMSKWQKDPGNKKMTVPGDDRTPAWSWIGYLYVSNNQVVIESDNLMSMLRDGGKKCPATTGRGSMKSQTQSGIIVNEIGWNLMVGGKEIPYAPIENLFSEPLDFERHEKLAEDLGFTLFVKRASIGQKKHVRVRPRFSNWSASGTVTVVDQTINKEMLETIFRFGGVYCGLCDWRPSSGSPGRFGMFTASVTEI